MAKKCCIPRIGGIIVVHRRVDSAVGPARCQIQFALCRGVQKRVVENAFPHIPRMRSAVYHPANRVRPPPTDKVGLNGMFSGCVQR